MRNPIVKLASRLQNMIKVRSALLAIFLGGALVAQTPPVSADQAFSTIKEIKDPAERADGFRKFLNDYSTSRPAHDLAGREMVDAAIAASPGDSAKALGLAKDALKSLSGISEAHVAAQFADGLLAANLALNDAEEFAKRALQSFTYEAFKPYALSLPAARRHVPSESSLHDQFTANQARILNTLGQTQVKQGKTAAGKASLEEALRKDPFMTETAYALAALSQGGDQRLAYLTHGYLAHPAKADRLKLEALYRTSHNNSLNGIEQYLDQQYLKMLPKSAPLEAWRGNPRRTVLLELLTGSACPPCLGMDRAFDQLMDRYPRNDLVVLMYHQNQGGPDPMTNYTTLNRFAYYNGVSAPTVILAGNVELGGGLAERAPEFAARLSGDVDAQLAIAAGAQIQLEGSLKGRDLQVHVEADSIEQHPASRLTLRLVVVDKEIHYSGETGVRFHPMVVRAMAEFPIETSTSKSVRHTFNLDRIAADLKEYHDDFERQESFISVKGKYERFNPDASYRWPNRLETIGTNGVAVAAFVQDDDTRKILQAAYLDLAENRSGTHQ